MKIKGEKSPKFLGSNLGGLGGTYVYEIFGDVKGLPSGRLCQKLRKLNAEIEETF